MHMNCKWWLNYITESNTSLLFTILLPLFFSTFYRGLLALVLLHRLRLYSMPLETPSKKNIIYKITRAICLVFFYLPPLRRFNLFVLWLLMFFFLLVLPLSCLNFSILFIFGTTHIQALYCGPLRKLRVVFSGGMVQGLPNVE